MPSNAVQFYKTSAPAPSRSSLPAKFYVSSPSRLLPAPSLRSARNLARAEAIRTGSDAAILRACGCGCGGPVGRALEWVRVGRAPRAPLGE